MDEKTQELIRKQTNAIGLMFVIILILLSFIIFLSYCQDKTVKVKESENSFFCGTDLLQKEKAENARNRYGLTGEFETGRRLFKQNCAVCHSVNNQDLTGPGLAGVFDRVPKPPIEWLKKYILNNDKVKNNGDAYSNMLSSKYREYQMTVFEEMLTEKEINDILYYLAGQ